MSTADGLPTIAAQAAGALGLFLLGMGLMSEGLRQAAGPALRHLLCAATRTRAQALGSGILVTALVQSSSAVTVATIGFVNAGLLALGPALWVLFGANVGTTMTGWIVATIGLKFKIEALAMPLIGLGALLRLSGQGQRASAFGTALAGFGLLFLGIALLQQTFGSLSAHLTLPQGEGASAVLARVGIGVLMTVLMQSSSAAMAITLTAAQGGLIDAQGAAAVVIGANIGTTATALMTTPGATPNARRAAWAHVAFNLITAVVALLLLPGLTAAVGLMGKLMALPPDPATQLALFHTLFNLLGVLLMWPLAERMTRALMQRWRSREEDEAAPVFLDNSVLIVPALALEALEREIDRVGDICARMLRSALLEAPATDLRPTLETLAQLDEAIDQFVERLRRQAMTAQASARLAGLLRRQHHHVAAATLVGESAGLKTAARVAPMRQAEAQDFTRSALQRLERDAPLDGSALQASYAALKTALLDAGIASGIMLSDLEEALRRCSALRRAVEQFEAARARGADR